VINEIMLQLKIKKEIMVQLDGVFGSLGSSENPISTEINSLSSDW
jgi:hypothetical protein